MGIVEKINSLLEDASKAQDLMNYLLKPEAMFPPVDKSRPYLYMDNLQREKMEKEAVSWILYLEITSWPGVLVEVKRDLGPPGWHLKALSLRIWKGATSPLDEILELKIKLQQ